MRQSTTFGDVKPAEPFFFFSTQLVAGQAVKARTGIFTDPSSGQQARMNCVVSKIDESVHANTAKLAPGDPFFIPDEGFVEVERPLPSGS